MVNITYMQQNDVEKVAKFIADLNSMESSHIGFCSKDSVEITEYFQEEIPFTHCFVTAFSDGELVGVLGIDPDFESGVGEVWGPFALNEHMDIVDEMWELLHAERPNNINSYILFPNKENKLVYEFANRNAFIKGSEQTILVFDRNDIQLLQDTSLKELTPEYYDDMKALHDHTFPGTYYSGEQIISRLDEHNKVLILLEDGELCGYVYVEAEPEFGDGSIEFVGVNEVKRGKGIGSQLVAGSLKWLFTFDTIESIRLTVSTENKTAINLYQKAGFKLKHSLYTFRKSEN
ncbi:GNAT family N-acetyltransferase [Ornithinibacillus sp. 179-J 7C1 HS]|uniref:GNAT family N-acetyltransferase n=1 Tax=Ornithinibacillus sp. 179-J 7C1 HS TaxID=3142384 RepID=UPI0039A2A343